MSNDPLSPRSSEPPSFSRPAEYDAVSSARPMSVHLPLAILALGLAVFMFAQIRSVAQQTKQLRLSITNAVTQNTNLKEAEVKLKELVAKREPQVAQSQQVRAKFESVLTDVIDLAGKGDADAKAVVERYHIEKNTPAATPAPR